MTVRFTLASDALTIYDHESEASARLDYAQCRAEEICSEILAGLRSAVEGSGFSVNKAGGEVEVGELWDNIPHYHGHLDFESEDPDFLDNCLEIAETADGAYSAEAV